MATTTTITLPLTVTLRHETYKKLLEAFKDVDPSQAIASRTQLFLENWADGAVVLKSTEVQEVEKALGRPVASARDIVQAATKGVGIEDGNRVFRFAIDPIYETPLKARADELGRAPKDLIADMIDVGLENDWLYGLEATGTRRAFTAEQERFFAKECGENFTVSDIQRLIRSHRKELAAVK